MPRDPATSGSSSTQPLDQTERAPSTDGNQRAGAEPAETMPARCHRNQVEHQRATTWDAIDIDRTPGDLGATRHRLVVHGHPESHLRGYQ